MTEAIRIGNPAIEIRLRRNARARRMTLRISRTADGPVLTLPPSVSLAKARAFALDQEGWLRRQLAASPGRVPVRDGTALPYRGGVLTLLRAEKGRTALRDGALCVAGPEALFAFRARAWLGEAARKRCLAASERYSKRLGRPFGRITLRDTRGRWGSCSSSGDLMYCWRLILAPDEVLDYVAAHEVAHLAEMNHSPAFWAVLRDLLPGYSAPQAWLKRHGPELMAYDFAPAS